MNREVLFSWEGKESEREEKSSDWYWTLGIISAALIVASVLFGNILLSILIAVAAGTIVLHALKHPPTHRFELTHDGLFIGNDFHPFERMTSFTVLEDIEGAHPPVLSVKTESVFASHLVIPLENVDVDGVYAVFLEYVDEGEHPHSFTDLVAHWLGL